MTHKIDHRILIPAGPEIIWEIVSDISKNPRWQVDCQEITFLTSLQQGQGTRWRYANERGREFVAEITAWYNTLGYEYHIVDGAPFKHNRGRIRLQEIAEGTIVQWTFNYELRGVLSGMRTIGTPRSVENVMIDSLWTLWKHITENDEASAHEARSLMRDAPDVEQRANYVARHQGGYQPAITMPPVQESPNTTNQPFTIEEPLIADDDTRPRPAVAAQPVEPATPAQEQSPTGEIAPNIAEPDFLREVREEDLDADTSPGVTAGTPTEAETTTTPDKSLDKAKSLDADDDSPFRPPEKSPEPPVELPADVAPPTTVEPSPAPEPQETGRVEQEETPAPVTDEESVSKPANPLEPAPTPQAALDDTANVSVFDLFGIPKPSETQEIQSVSAPTAPDEPATTVTDAPVEKDEPPQEPEPVTASPAQEPLTGKAATQEAVAIPASPEADDMLTAERIGLRLRLRRDLVNLRRP